MPAELIQRTDRRRTTVAPPKSAPRARQFHDGQFNRFLATLPPHDFALLVPLCARSRSSGV
jgi:hypothetical protein